MTNYLFCTYRASYQINQREFDEFLYSYIIEYHVVKRALKERKLKGQSVRAVIQTVLENEV